jgi:hypothetical protein
MFNQTYGGYSLADIAAVTGGNGNNRNNGGFGGEDSWWIILLFLFIGWGRNGNWGGDSNGGYGNGSAFPPYFVPGFGGACATKDDVRAAVDQQTLISKLDNQTYGLSDSTYALNNAITSGFHGVDNAICTLGYQNQAGFTALGNQIASCCCDTRAAIADVKTQGIMNTNTLSSQLAACCCDLEKANMENRFAAQTYNCNTLQAIDKLGDRIIDFMTQDKIASLTAENQSLKFAASQANQNAFITANQEAQTAELIRRLSTPCPVPAYVVPNPNCCYDYQIVRNTGCCNSGCGF